MLDLTRWFVMPSVSEGYKLSNGTVYGRETHHLEGTKPDGSAAEEVRKSESAEVDRVRTENAQLRQERDALNYELQRTIKALADSESGKANMSYFKVKERCERAEGALRTVTERAVKIIRDELEHWDYSDLADNNKSDLELFVDNVCEQIGALAALKSSDGGVNEP